MVFLVRFMLLVVTLRRKILTRFTRRVTQRMSRWRNRFRVFVVSRQFPRVTVLVMIVVMLLIVRNPRIIQVGNLVLFPR